jgi:predicted outer membrane protein
MPAGQMAAEKGSSEKVRKVGAEIAAQHYELDQLVVDAANKLGVQLPTEPNAAQKGWLNEMQNASGTRFDRIFVDRLRAAHGAIFPVIGAVRSGTRNDIVRKLAEQANGYVMNHMTLLESTGLVRYAELPPVALPAPQDDSLVAAAQANAEFGTGLSTSVIWAVLIGALALGSIATVRVFRRS